jgi:dipeptide transport system ATP-binding protein
MNYQPALLKVENLSVDFQVRGRNIKAIESVDLDVQAGETVAIVGESGSGKSVTSLAIMGLIKNPGNIRSGKVWFNGQDMLAKSIRQRRKYLGKDLSMIFQEPSDSLNPSFTIGDQITEVLKLHENMNRVQRQSRALELLHEVGISDPEKCYKSWPHQLSGGMNQRVMIAMAVSCNPSLLVADEPTTALDVTVQAQILALLQGLQQKNNMGMVFITHDLSVVANIAHRVVVMYAGQVVENCLVSELFEQPQHPYTEALLKSLPARHRNKNERLYSIKGSPPKAGEVLKGCRFYTRCNYAMSHCREETPELLNAPVSSNRMVRCFNPLVDARAVSAGNS